MFCRVRPCIREDGHGASAALVVQPDAEDDGLLNVRFKARDHSFEVDRVFSAESSQKEVHS